MMIYTAYTYLDGMYIKMTILQFHDQVDSTFGILVNMFGMN